MLDAATPAPWHFGHDPDGSDPQAYIAEAYSYGPPGRVHLVCVPMPGKNVNDEALFTAITGNGPTSEANSRAIAALRNAAAALLADSAARERAEADRDAWRDALQGLHREWARGDGHGTAKATADCIAGARVTMSIDHGDEVRELTARADTAERALAEARERSRGSGQSTGTAGSKAGSCTGLLIPPQGHCRSRPRIARRGEGVAVIHVHAPQPKSMRLQLSADTRMSSRPDNSFIWYDRT